MSLVDNKRLDQIHNINIGVKLIQVKKCKIDLWVPSKRLELIGPTSWEKIFIHLDSWQNESWYD